MALVEGAELAGVPETETEERELDEGAVDEGEGVVAGGVLTALMLVVLDTETEVEVETGLEVWLLGMEEEAEAEAEPETVPDGEVERQLVEPVCDQRGEGGAGQESTYRPEPQRRGRSSAGCRCCP